jgi:hypothetical protein
MSIYDNRGMKGEVREGRDLLVQDRDLDALRLVFDHGYLTSEMLRLFLAPDIRPDTWSKALKRLINHRLLVAPAAQVKNPAYRSSLVYDITPQGVALLIEEGRISVEDAERRKAFFAKKRKEFWHDLSAAMTVASIRLAARQAGVSFVTPWTILRKASQPKLSLRISEDRHIVPDYLFGLVHGDDYRFYWFEHDHNTEQLTKRKTVGSSFERKLEELNQVFTRRLHQTAWGLPGLTVLTVTLNENRAATMLDELAAKLPNKRKFLFRGYCAFKKTNLIPKPSLNLFSEDWAAANGWKRIDGKEVS